MAVKEYTLKFGRGEQSFLLEEEKVVQIIDAPASEQNADIKTLVKEALANPIASEPLQKIVNKEDKVVILVSDITRAWSKTAEYLPYVIEELTANGLPDENISIIIATGTHRHNNDDEKKLILGEEIFNRFAVYDHDAYGEDSNVFLGTTSRGTLVYLDKRAVEADKVILTGAITPHIFAGFGGGRKSVMPGISSDKTVNGNHLLALSDEVGGGINPDTCLARVEGNRVSEDMTEVASFLKPAFLVNVIMDADGGFYKVVAGDWHEAWLEGTRIVMKQQGAEAKGKTDIVISGGGGYPRDMNLYQGVKAYVPAAMTLKEKGVMIAVLECEDIAEPPAFFGCFRYDDLLTMENDVRNGFTIPFYVAFYTCWLAERFSIILVTKPENFELAARSGVTAVATVQEAITLAERIVGREDYTVSIIPNAMSTIPLFK